MRTTVGAAVIALAAVLTGCGDDVPTTPKVTPNASAPVGSLERFCAEMARYNSAALRSDATKDQLAKGIVLARDAIVAARTHAPAEIKADTTLVAETYVPFAQAIAAVGYDYTKLTPEQKKVLSGQAFTASLKRVGNYRRAHCPA